MKNSILDLELNLRALVLDFCIVQQLQALTDLTLEIPDTVLPALLLTSVHPDSETSVYGLDTSFSGPAPYLLLTTTICISASDQHG